MAFGLFSRANEKLNLKVYIGLQGLSLDIAVLGSKQSPGIYRFEGV